MENTSLASLTIEDLSNQIAQLKQENATLKAQLVWFTEQNRLKQSMLFGQSSDQVPANQMNLFNEAEAEAKPEAREPDMEVIETYRRRKQVGQREEDLENLPVETIDYRLSEEEQVCCACGEHLHEMSTEVRQELKIIPAQVKVVKHIRHVYACRNCDKNADKTPVITAPMPRPLIAGSLASPTAAAYIMDQKFVPGIPCTNFWSIMYAAAVGDAALPPGEAI
jgi:transposase